MPTKPKLDKINAAIESTKQHAEEVLEGSSQKHTKTLAHLSKPLTMNNLDEIVMYFKWKYDQDLGINWHVKGDSLVRDASYQTDQNYNIKAAQATAWTGQFANSCRGALMYLDYQHQQNNLDTTELNKKIADLLDHALKNGGSNLQNKNDLAMYNTALINHIADAVGLKSTKEKKKLKVDLEKAICCAGLRDPHYNISTITSLGNGNFSIESDVKLDGLTAKMKDEVATVARNKFGDKNGPKWYEKLADSSYDQFLSVESCKQFDDAHYKKVIPTQFLPFKLMPGLRNAYVETTYGKKAGGEVTELLQTYRSSNPIVNYKKDQDFNLEATKDSISAFAENIPGEKICLNPLTNNALEEEKFHTLINKAVKENNDLSKGETPVNGKRILHRNRDLTGFLEIVKIAEKELKGKKFDKDDSSIKAALENLEECKKRLGNSFLNLRAPDSLGDNGYRLSAAMGQLVHDLKRGSLKQFIDDDNANKIPELTTFCKSGKDRTGIKMRIGSDAALSDYLGYDVHSATIRSAHQQHLCGAGGGVPLCYGIKGEFGSAMPREYTKQNLGLKTADGNRFPHTKKFEKSIDINGGKDNHSALSPITPSPTTQQHHHIQHTDHTKGSDNIPIFSSLFLGLLFGGGYGLLLIAVMLAIVMEKDKTDIRSKNTHESSHTKAILEERKNNRDKPKVTDISYF